MILSFISPEQTSWEYFFIYDHFFVSIVDSTNNYNFKGLDPSDWSTKSAERLFNQHQLMGPLQGAQVYVGVREAMTFSMQTRDQPALVPGCEGGFAYIVG